MPPIIAEVLLVALPFVAIGGAGTFAYLTDPSTNSCESDAAGVGHGAQIQLCGRPDDAPRCPGTVRVEWRETYILGVHGRVRVFACAPPLEPVEVHQDTPVQVQAPPAPDCGPGHVAIPSSGVSGRWMCTLRDKLPPG